MGIVWLSLVAFGAEPDGRLIESGAILGGSGAALVVGSWVQAHHQPSVDPVTGGALKAVNATGFALLGVGAIKVGFGLAYRLRPPAWTLEVTPTGAAVDGRFK